MPTLVLLRHGESTWNAEGLFTGWIDVDLSDKGRGEARRAGELLAAAGLLPDIVHTSVLRRSIRTTEIALDVADRLWIPVERSWRLNERHYGALQGKDKAAVRKDVVVRLLPYWYDAIVPALNSGRIVLLSAHGNSLRALVRHLDSIADADIPELNVPTGIPLRYDLDDEMRPTRKVDARTGVSGEYLDAEAAIAAAAAVAAQGSS